MSVPIGGPSVAMGDAGPPPPAADTSLRHLFARLSEVERRVRRAVAGRRRSDPNPDDPYRGLYLTEEAVAALLAARREPYEGVAAVPAEGRLGGLVAGAALTALDSELLLVALAPDVDSRFEQFYGYLNDDVTRRRATVGMALRLCGVPEAAMVGRSRLTAGAPLVDVGLVAVEEPDRPLLSRSLRVPDRVVAHLLGSDVMDPALAGLVTTPAPVPGMPEVARLACILAEGTDGLGGCGRLVYLREHPGGSGTALAATALAATGRAALCLDTTRLAAESDPAGAARAVLREAVLRRAGVVVGPLEAGPGGGTGAVSSPEPVLAALARAAVPVLGYGTQPWDPHWSEAVPVPMEVRALPAPARADLWRAAIDAPIGAGADPVAATAHFVLAPYAIGRAARAAAVHATMDGGVVLAEHLRAGARSQNAAGLGRLARRIEPAVSWPDLVLPADARAQLAELAARVRHRDRVLDQWRMRPGGGRGRGVTALFAGDSGTGKTMSAEVIAAELGMDLYAVNLATIVDKYVGETEKNLERVFTEAAGVNGVLLFDEADAIFGKRSEVRDAHDRYANIESAYLLQRMETFDGLAVLATNLRANLDEAFTRRLDMVVDFPVPDEVARRALWDRCLGPLLPRCREVDLDFLAGAFELAGGHIRSAAITAAYLSAEADRPVTMTDLVGAVGREYRKLGRMCLEREFGPYLELVAGG